MRVSTPVQIFSRWQLTCIADTSNQATPMIKRSVLITMSVANSFVTRVRTVNNDCAVCRTRAGLWTLRGTSSVQTRLKGRSVLEIKDAALNDRI
jgi:hypothetical protein